ARLRAATEADRTRLVERGRRRFGGPRPQSVELYLRRGGTPVSQRGTGRGGRTLVAWRGTAPAGYALGISRGALGYLGSASAEDGDVLLELLASLATELHGEGTALRTLVPATARRLGGGLLGVGFRVFRACHYMVRGGGTAPPPNYVLMNGDLM